MDIQKRRFKTVLILLSICSFAFGQTWKVEVVHVDSLQALHVSVTPDYVLTKEHEVFFQENFLKQNEISNLKVGKLVDGEIKYTVAKSPLLLNPAMLRFEYLVDLKNSDNIPTKAYLAYKQTLIANWDEILFSSEKALLLSIDFYRSEQEDEEAIVLGTNSLDNWKKDPSVLLPLKVLVEINNISVYSNLPNKNLSDLMEKTLANFNYFEEDFSLYVLFGNDSSQTGGAYYDKSAIVYIDAKNSDPDFPYVIEHVVLHELFHGLSPYEIRPEMEAKLLDKNWLAEATPEYLSLKYMVKYKIISEKVFLEVMESKLRIAERFAGISLNDMALEVYRNPSYYQAFYSKGAVALFLLDLQLYKESNGLVNIQDLISGSFPELSEEMQLSLNSLLTDMEQDLVYNENAFPINKVFVDFGLLYEKRVVLPFNENTEKAEIRKENISFNKMSNTEQKARWQGFIAN